MREANAHRCVACPLTRGSVLVLSCGSGYAEISPIVCIRSGQSRPKRESVFPPPPHTAPALIDTAVTIHLSDRESRRNVHNGCALRQRYESCCRPSVTV